MNFIDIIAMSWKNLMVNKTRSLLTVLGISVGIGTIVFLVSLGYGLQDLSIKKITAISSLTTLDVAPAQGNVVMNQSVVDGFSKLPNVQDVSPLLSLAGQISRSDKKTDVVGYGVKPDYFGYQGIRVATGGVFSGNDQAVISSGAATALKLAPADLVGQTITFTSYFAKDNSGTLTTKDFKFTVSGVIDDNSSSYGYFPLVSDFLTAGTVYNSAKVKVDKAENLDSVKNAILSKGFKVTSIADTINQVYQIFKIVQIVLASFGAIALFVASIGMFNTMTIALLERTRDIGIMKSIGVQNDTVRKIFLTESFMISFFGGFIGAATGILLGQIVNLIINGLAASVGDQPEKLFSTPVLIILAIIGFSVVVGVSTGFYPAGRAGKLNPLDALRYE